MGHVLEAVDGAATERAQNFYRKVLGALNGQEIEYMVGGSFAAYQYTRRTPHTKDLDIFLPPSQVDGALDALAGAGLATEKTYPFWIAKACAGDDFVDLIFRAASGLWEVEDSWLERASPAEFWGVTAPVCPVEELIWTKAALMDRDRYDGNDVVHLLQARAHEVDWERLRSLAGQHWRLLLSHLTLFGYVYPDLMPLIPKHLLAEFALRLLNERPPDDDEAEEPLCRGTLISNSMYQQDVEELGYRDARLQPVGRLLPEELQPWVEAIKRGDT